MNEKEKKKKKKEEEGSEEEEEVKEKLKETKMLDKYMNRKIKKK